VVIRGSADKEYLSDFAAECFILKRMSVGCVALFFGVFSLYDLVAGGWWMGLQGSTT
jgi:hypothetical protein